MEDKDEDESSDSADVTGAGAVDDEDSNDGPLLEWVLMVLDAVELNPSILSYTLSTLAREWMKITNYFEK